MSAITDYIKFNKFFKDFTPDIKNAAKKLAGKSSYGSALDFTDEEKRQINKAIDRLAKKCKFDV